MPARVPIMCDAAAAIAFTQATGVGQMKYLDLREAWIQEMRGACAQPGGGYDVIADQGKCELIKIDGKMNPADFFTKVLPACEFVQLSNSMMVHMNEYPPCVPASGRSLAEYMKLYSPIRGDGEI